MAKRPLGTIHWSRPEDRSQHTECRKALCGVEGGPHNVADTYVFRTFEYFMSPSATEVSCAACLLLSMDETAHEQHMVEE